MDNKEVYEEQEQEYVMDSMEGEKKEEKENEKKEEQQPMGDVYDVYGKAVRVHSRISGMTEDYTLTKYNIDVYNMKVPKFIREQRKLLRIIKSYMIVPKEQLVDYYNTEEVAEDCYKRLLKEYALVEELLLGELDEMVIMARSDEGQVIKAFLKHGMNPELREDYDSENDTPTVGSRLTEERGRRR